MGSLKHTYNQLIRSGRVVPKKLWEILVDINSRISVLESSITQNLANVTGDITFTGLVSAIGANKVKTSNIAMFVSTVQTANGNAQNVAHGLGVSPSTVVVIPVSTLAGATSFSFTKGTTNVVVTGTNTATYMVLAIA